MALILDTSAVIGWVERRNQNVVQALAATERLPVISIVTLGELFQNKTGFFRGKWLLSDHILQRSTT